MTLLDRSIHGGLCNDEQRDLQTRLPEGRWLVDLSVNLNPEGPPESVLRAIHECALRSYPEPYSQSLRQRYGEHLDAPPAGLLFGNGACDLLWTLASQLAHPNRPALLCEPTFSEFGRAVLAHKGELLETPRRRDQGLRPCIDEILTIARRANVSSLYLCRPNNPTGHVLPWEALLRLATSLPHIPVVLDESFLSLSTAHEDERRPLPSNVLRVRSLTKDFGLAGLRLGYLQASPSWVATLEALQPPWSTSSCAQAAAHALLDEDEFLHASRRRLLNGREQLERGMQDRGFVPLPSETVFSLVPVGSATDFRERLLAQGVVVRDASSFGLPHHVRIFAGTEACRQRLWQALDTAAPATP